MSDILKIINFNIKCPKCKQFPIIDFPFNENYNSIIKYKCHSQNYEQINLENFHNLFLSSNCLLCDQKGNYKCFCSIFCEDDYLYHILISKHNNYQNIINFNINNIFEFYCFNCDKKYIKKNFKNEEHNNHYFIEYDELLKKFINYSLFLTENIKNIKINKIDILYSILFPSIYYFQLGYFKYIYNLQYLFIQIVYYLKENNININEFYYS